MDIERRAVEIRLESDPARSGPGLLVGVLMPYGHAGARPSGAV